MPRPARLTDAQLRDALARLPKWEVRNDKLHRVYRFADFSEAFGFMARAALVAERLDHHPEWSNVYATVTVDLVTHDADGITALDAELAEAMDAIVGSSGS